MPEFDYRKRGYAYFLTLCAKGSQPLFNDRMFAPQVVAILLDLRSQFHVKVFAYCLMPDHLHLVVFPQTQGKSLPEFVRELKKLTTRAGWQCDLKGAIWQRSFYDHVVRRGEDLRSICEYILGNPLRAGLATRDEEYAFSGTPDAIPS
ncbi:MAG: transposase [Nitrospinota bacterium]